jgi:hypothetical protein
MDEWMNEWMHGCMDAWMHGCMDEWMERATKQASCRARNPLRAVLLERCWKQSGVLLCVQKTSYSA